MSQRHAFSHVEAWFPLTPAAAPFFRLRLRPLRRRCSPACWRWLGASRWHPLQVHKIIEAIHFLSISGKKYRNWDERSQTLTSELADAVVDDKECLCREDISALEGLNPYMGEGYRRNRGRADQNFEKTHATIEQVLTTEQLEELGVHFFKDIPDANGAGKDRHGNDARVFGDQDEHRVFFVNGISLILGAMLVVLSVHPMYSEMFEKVKKTIMASGKFKPSNDGDTWNARTVLFFAREFLQRAVGKHASSIFDTIAEGQEKGKELKVEVGEGLRKEAKSHNWKQLFDNYMNSGTESDHDTLLRVRIGFYLARVLVCLLIPCNALFKLSETLPHRSWITRLIRQARDSIQNRSSMTERMVREVRRTSSTRPRSSR
jgi:hypothetical protein